MSKLEYTYPLMSRLTNIYKSGGVKCTFSNSSCDDINVATHTCGRLFARAVQRVAFVVSILFLLGACQKATLISSDEYDKSTRGTEEVSDTTDVDVNVETDGWAGAIDVGFGFGGEENE